jgi:hypothetical protein
MPTANGSNHGAERGNNMTLADFARNYLNPFYVVFRLGWLGMAFAMFMAWLGSSSETWYLIVALILAWNGLRPWGKGMSVNDLNNAANNIRNDLDKRR